MRFPIDTARITVLAIGEPRPVVEYGTGQPKLTNDGKAVVKVPVLLLGTGDRTEPTTTITITGELPEIKSGAQLTCVNLTATTWSLRDSSGRERSGVTLRADSITVKQR